MDRFENMETFIHVVEVGSISGAANRMGTAKSAVSRRLKELEGHLGVELFYRTTQKMNLTNIGRTFYQQSARIIEDVIEAELATSQAHGKLQGSLKTALLSNFGVMYMGPAIIDFLLAHPRIEFHLDFNDREVDLIQEGFDLAIWIARLPDSSLIARQIAPIQHVLCASSGYLEKHGTPQSLDELPNHQCLAYSLLHDFKTWEFTNKINQKFKITINLHIKASVGEFLRDAAVNEQRIVYLSNLFIDKEIENGILLPLLKEFTPRQIDTYAIHPQTRHLLQRVRVLVNFLVTRFEGTPYWDQNLNLPPIRHYLK